MERLRYPEMNQALEVFSAVFEENYPESPDYSLLIHPVVRIPLAEGSALEIDRKRGTEKTEIEIRVFVPKSGQSRNEAFAFDFDQDGLISFADMDGSFASYDPVFRKQAVPLILWALNCYFQDKYLSPPEQTLETIKLY